MMKAWDLLRNNYKADGKGRYKTVDAMKVAKQLEREIERLKKYEGMVWFIANDYQELSSEKTQWQRDDWKDRCQKLITEDVKKNFGWKK